MENAYEALIARCSAWAETQADLRGIFIVGSRARSDRPADQFSDLDLVLASTDPGRYIRTTEWLAALGTPHLTFLEPAATGGMVERRVLFEGGMDVDFIPVPAAALESWAAEGVPGDIAGVLGRGMRVLLDKDSQAQRLFSHPVTMPPPAPPTEAEFANLVHDFWYHVLWTAKKWRRGEQWTAVTTLNSYLPRLTLRMIEWHAGATHGWAFDTWHQGRFLEQWAHPRAVDGLAHVFAHYDAADAWRALFAAADLFRSLATETAATLGYPYPAEGERCVTGLLRTLADTD